MEIITRFQDKTYLCYGRGRFDDYCVFYKNSKGKLIPPLDIEYFGQMKRLANKYGTQQVYKDFVNLFNRTGKEKDKKVFRWIRDISKKYGEDAVKVQKTFAILYLSMLAEENKEGSIIGKRIKRLGIHTLLLLNKDVYYSANFMKKMKWRQIDKICKENGF